MKVYIEKNPDIEEKLARSLASHVLQRQDGDEEKAAYSWLYGHNLSPRKIEKMDYQDEPYVKKYKKLNLPTNSLRLMFYYIAPVSRIETIRE